MELLDLLTVELNSHVVSSGNQVRSDLHLLHAKIVFIVIYILVLIIIVLVFTVAKSMILNLFAITATFLSVELHVVFFIIASRIFLLVAILLVANHAFKLLFAHLVEVILLIVAIGHYASNILS